MKVFFMESAAKKVPKIPPLQYMRFSRAKDKSETELLNNAVIEKEIGKEKRIALRLENNGELVLGNGLELFLQACRRRLRDPTWGRILDHSHNVRKYAYCISNSWQKQKELNSTPLDAVSLYVIEKVSGYHDIGKTLITPYLVNKEDGTWFGIGKGARIDFKKELDVLRLAHLEAGLKLLGVYKAFMDSHEYETARWVIAGHHLAHNGIGTASAPSYPAKIDGLDINAYIMQNGLPLVSRIMRTADIYCAILENRFYLAESERIVMKAKNVAPDDAALSMLITVAGIDVDPAMVGCLLMGKYKLEPEVASMVVKHLSCKERDVLSKRGGDIKFSLEKVLPAEVFQAIISRAPSTDWKRLSAMMKDAQPLV